MRRLWLIMSISVVLVACAPNPTIPPTPTKTPFVLTNDDRPTATPLSTVIPTMVETKTVPTDEPTPSSPPEITPPPQNDAPPPPTLLPPTPNNGLPAENYCMIRPIPSGWQDYLDRTYPYGSTSGGQYRPHAGGDFQVPASTPVVAVGNATVIHAGNDWETQFGPDLRFYGNLVVLQINSCFYDGRPVYALYGHLSDVRVEVGQEIAQGEIIGAVGGTGVAAGGAHLHFEVRVDDAYDYFTATRNPDLWIRPYGGYGTLAGRVVDAQGNYLPNASIQIRRDGTDDLPRFATSYVSDENRPDDAWGENFTYGDLPEGWYTVSTDSGRYTQQVYIRPGETSWVEFVIGS